MTEEQEKRLKAIVQQLKDAYNLLGQNKSVMQDLRTFCEVTIPQIIFELLTSGLFL